MTATAVIDSPDARALMRSVGVPLHFGPVDRRLFGMLHEPASGGDARERVLLCPPFGQEAVRLHRFFRVLAERLSRQGALVLRFDYFGTGDSEGSDADGDYGGWMADVDAAQAVLQERGPVVPVLWAGAGLGATIAMSAAARVAAPPARLVVWEPVIDGRAYLASLRERHVETLEASYSLWDPSWRRALTRRPDAFTAEAVGFAVPVPLREAIHAIEPDGVGRDLPCDIDVVADPENAPVRAWAARLGGRVRQVTPLANDFEWTAEELRGAALVPTAALKTLLSLCAT